MANEVRLIDAIALNKRFDEKEADDIELYGVHIADCFPSDEAKEIVDQMPTIDPESLRPKGRWETANDGTHFCPHCGCDAPYTWDDIDRSFINSADDVPDRPSNYCPNCGAKMEG